MGGSWPKFLLMLGSADAGQLAIIGVLILSSLLNVGYLLSIPLQAFWLEAARDGAKPQGLGGGALDWRAIEEAPILCLAPIIVTAAATLALFVLADPLYAYLSPMLETR
jgi:multicomponent Na+:H+ antiporter subunit D